MRETQHLLDPTSERSPAVQPRGDVFLDRIEEHLTDRGLTVKRYMKPTLMRKAPPAILDVIVDECDVVIEALSD